MHGKGRAGGGAIPLTIHIANFGKTDAAGTHARALARFLSALCAAAACTFILFPVPLFPLDPAYSLPEKAQASSVWPLPSPRLSVDLGFLERYEFSGATYTHRGVDIEADAGACISSPVDGTVSFVGEVPAGDASANGGGGGKRNGSRHGCGGEHGGRGGAELDGGCGRLCTRLPGHRGCARRRRGSELGGVRPGARRSRRRSCGRRGFRHHQLGGCSRAACRAAARRIPARWRPRVSRVRPRGAVAAARRAVPGARGVCRRTVACRRGRRRWSRGGCRPGRRPAPRARESRRRAGGRKASQPPSAPFQAAHRRRWRLRMGAQRIRRYRICRHHTAARHARRMRPQKRVQPCVLATSQNSSL